MKKPYFQYFFDISLISQEIVDNPRTNNDQHKIPYKIESFQERSNDLHVTMGGSWWKHPTVDMILFWVFDIDPINSDVDTNCD